jgi:excisionase family DNA binding protein
MEQLLTVADVARITKLSVYTIRAAVREGELAATKLRGRVLVKPEDLQAWIDANRIQPAPVRSQYPEIPPGGYRELVRRRRASQPPEDARETVKRRRRARGQ